MLLSLHHIDLKSAKLSANHNGKDLLEKVKAAFEVIAPL